MGAKERKSKRHRIEVRDCKKSDSREEREKKEKRGSDLIYPPS